MKTLTFSIHLLEPVLITRLGRGDPNSSRGYEFIPGSVIRGLLIGRYLQGNRTDAGDTDFRRLFLDGRVRFLNAYPLDSFGVRTLPTPRSWFVEKGEEEPICDLAVEKEHELENPRGVEKPFCRLYSIEESDTDQVMLYKPARQVNIHTFREERTRVTKQGSTVFRYEAIAADEKFGGVILAEETSALETLRPLLTDAEFSIGGSNTAGYGYVHVESDSIKIESGWREYEPVGEENEDLIITLLSDAVLRDANGTYTTDLDQIIGEKHKQAYATSCFVGGFNRKWGLPLPQTLAAQSGSVYVYSYSNDLLARLRTLEITGIGERRVEGFGRIAINWHQASLLKNQSETTNNKPPPVQLQGESAKLAQQMAERMVRTELDQALIARVNKLTIYPRPNNTQLSRMRIVVRRALAENDAGCIIQHLDGMKRTASEQFDRARIISGQRLGEWLRERASSPQTIWSELRVGGVKRPSIGEVQPDFSDTLALEYTIRLVDGVLHKAAKEEGQ